MIDETEFEMIEGKMIYINRGIVDRGIDRGRVDRYIKGIVQRVTSNR